MKAKDSSKGHEHKKTYISDQAFADLKQALEDALAFERAERRGLKVTRFRAARPPKASRMITIRHSPPSTVRKA